MRRAQFTFRGQPVGSPPPRPLDILRGRMADDGRGVVIDGPPTYGDVHSLARDFASIPVYEVDYLSDGPSVLAVGDGSGGIEKIFVAKPRPLPTVSHWVWRNLLWWFRPGLGGEVF